MIEEITADQIEVSENFPQIGSVAVQAAIRRLNNIDYSFLSASDSHDYSPRRVTVCIVAHQESEEVKVLLQTIGDLSSNTDFSFCLVSNSDRDLFEHCALPSATRKICIGANLGASLGRNAAIHSCGSEYIIFIDDDGLTTTDCIRSLFETAQKYDATGVRGRVIPRGSFLETPAHYDRGDFIIPHYMDIEGMTLWRMDALKKHNFDPLLYGHEGLDLTARLYPYYGPNAFLYDPNAILLHDFGSAQGKGAEKWARMKQNDIYLAQSNPEIEKIKKTFRNYSNAPLNRHALKVRQDLIALPRPCSPDQEVTIVTTCYNGASFVAKYAESLKRQTDKNFSIVFVDDGSDDGTEFLARKALESFDRVKLIRTDHVGRGAALNVALSNVDTDIVLIADIDDIPAPQRVDWTRRVYNANPGFQAVGFGICDKSNAIREQSPYCLTPTSLRNRALLGMPMPFPAFSFRKSALTLPFDENLKGGIDCHWLFHNIIFNQVDGVFYPTSLVYYEVHDDQISAGNNGIQKSIKAGSLQAYYQSILGLDEKVDSDGFELLTGETELSNGAAGKMDAYASRLAQNLQERCPRNAVDAVMQIYRMSRKRAGRYSTSPIEQLQTKRLRKYKRLSKVSLILNTLFSFAIFTLVFWGA